MNPSNGNILVRFHEEIETPLGLIVPERYVVHEQSEDGGSGTGMGVTTDRRLINPQVVDVLSGKYEGEQAFVYYGAYEMAVWPDDRAIIKESNVLFLLNPVRPVEGIFLGEEVRVEPDKTDSGIYRSTNTGGVDGIKVRLLHVSGVFFQQGDIIVTQDSAQYWLIYEGKKYLMVKDHYIAGYYRDGLKPYGRNLIVELTPNMQDAERISHNDRMRANLYFMKKYGMHYDPKEFEMQEEPKIIPALWEGKKCLIERSGVKVDGKLIIEKSALCGVFESEGIEGLKLKAL